MQASHLKPVKPSLQMHCPVFESQKVVFDPYVVQLHAAKKMFENHIESVTQYKENYEICLWRIQEEHQTGCPLS